VRPGGSAPRRRPRTAAPLIWLAISLAAPVLAYLLLRQHVHSGITALAAATRRNRVLPVVRGVGGSCSASQIFWACRTRVTSAV
jgi:hypothetical protein